MEFALSALILRLVFGFWTAAGWICAGRARRRHRSAAAWFGLGLAFHFVAVLAIALLPDLEQHCRRCKRGPSR